MGITIKDVAKQANVSPSTVSRVISNNSKISKATADKVKTVMAELNYQPNQVARSLTNKSTKTLGLLLPGSETELLSNPFFIQTIRGVVSYAKSQGFYVLLTYASKKEDPVKVIDNLLSSRWVDGIILTTAKTNDKRINFLANRKHPFVVIGRPDNVNSTLWVDNDNITAMFEVVSHLINLGHNRIAFMSGPSEFHVTQDRLNGYKKALSDNNINFDKNIIFERDYSENSAYDTTNELLKYTKPDAIVTTDDMIAFGAQHYLSKHNIDDISLVGFNNTSLSQFKTSGITSVDINAQELGKKATKLLISSILKEESSVNNYIVETKLVERNTIIDRRYIKDTN